jgi:hypothetical protein
VWWSAARSARPWARTAASGAAPRRRGGRRGGHGARALALARPDPSKRYVERRLAERGYDDRLEVDRRREARLRRIGHAATHAPAREELGSASSGASESWHSRPSTIVESSRSVPRPGREPVVPGPPAREGEPGLLEAPRETGAVPTQPREGARERIRLVAEHEGDLDGVAGAE